MLALLLPCMFPVAKLTGQGRGDVRCQVEVRLKAGSAGLMKACESIVVVPGLLFFVTVKGSTVGVFNDGERVVLMEVIAFPWLSSAAPGRCVVPTEGL